jgi:hypothetical protein
MSGFIFIYIIKLEENNFEFLEKIIYNIYRKS